MQGLERGALHRPDRRIVDEFRGRRRGERGPEGGELGVERQAWKFEDVDKDRIEEPAVRGVIGARPFAIPGEQHVQRAHAEIGRPGASGRLARARQRRKIPDALIAGATHGVDLRRNAEALAQRRLGPIGLRRRNRQNAVDAVDHQAVTADRQIGECDRPLGDGAPVWERPRRPVAGCHAPFANAAVLALDPGLGSLRRIAQRRHERLVETHDEGGRHTAPARLVDDPGKTFVCLRVAARFKPERRQEGDLGFGRDNGVVAADVPPFRGDACGAGKRVNHGRARWTAFKAEVRRSALAQNDARARGEPPAVGEDDGPLRRVGPLSVGQHAPAHSRARLRQRELYVLVAAIHRDRDAIGSFAMRSGEHCDQNRAWRIVPGRGGQRTLGVAPFDIGQGARVERRARQERVAREGRAGVADRDKPANERDHRSVCGVPIDRRRRIVLGVGIVVAALAEPELRAHREHRRSARRQQQGQEIALVARAGRKNRRIFGWPLDAMIPGKIGVGSVPVEFAVRLVVLVLISHEIGEREAIVRDHEVDAFRRRLRAREDVAGAGHPRRDLAP